VVRLESGTLCCICTVAILVAKYIAIEQRKALLMLYMVSPHRPAMNPHPGYRRDLK
jgi:hypothetical protein